MTQIVRLESLNDFTFSHKSPPDALFIISGALLNTVREEFEKGLQARRVLEAIVRLGNEA